MRNTLIIHDLNADKIINIFGEVSKDKVFFHATKDIKPCVGCFKCWVKTPGKCVIKDMAYKLPKLMGECSEIILISENLYGGFSVAVKRALDRSIGYILPFFCIIGDEMHHVMRYDNAPEISAHFYGENIIEEEKKLAENLLKANAINLGAIPTDIKFYSSIDSMKGQIL